MSAQDARGWFVQCGSCDGNGWVRNAAVIRDGACEHCQNDGVTDDLTGVMDRLVATELGWCGCGNPERVDEMMLAYLQARNVEGWPKPEVEDVSEDAEMLLAYIADGLGWTEHGTSIGGAWLTEEGKTAMRNLAAAREVTK